MAHITNIITIHEYTKMTAEQRAALAGENLLAVVQQDWEEVRIQAAIAAMQGMLANPEHHKTQVESGVPCSYFYAVNAVICADDLIAELQKKGGQNETD